LKWLGKQAELPNIEKKEKTPRIEIEFSQIVENITDLT